MNGGSRMVVFLAILVIYAGTRSGCSARILSRCEATKELIRGGVQRSFLSTYVCIMMSESNMDTRKKVGPGYKASYSYGVFQISSDRWCSAYRPGGLCNKHCNDFLNDDIQDDIACAKLIAARDGFKYWKGWVRMCKNGKLPDIIDCVYSRKQNTSDGPFSDWSSTDESDFSDS